MARGLNRVTLIGNVGADPEIRSTKGGVKVAHFSLATSRQWTDRDDEKQEKTEWHRYVAFGGRKGDGIAGVIADYVGKGDRLYVEGEIRYSSYEDKEKVTRYTTEIHVTNLVMLGGNRERDSESAERRPSRNDKARRR